MFELRISPRAQRQIKQLKKTHQDAVLEALSEISEEPELVGKALSRNLAGNFTYRVGVYRILYKVKQKDRIVQILSAEHRSRAYS